MSVKSCKKAMIIDNTLETTWDVPYVPLFHRSLVEISFEISLEEVSLQIGFWQRFLCYLVLVDISVHVLFGAKNLF